MQVVRLRLGSADHFGSLNADGTVHIGGSTINAWADGSTRVAREEVTLLPPIQPSKIICVGLNYRDHASETKSDLPAAPVLFAKFPSAVIGDGDAIEIPVGTTDFVDYEAELGVVIGRTARAVPTSDALAYVFGYTCVNDVSARDAQVADGQWVRAKSFDTFCPVGPWIVPAEEVPDPQNLSISCDVNGIRLQDSSTAGMIVTVAELISYISRTTTLFPGDLIATGTPSGVGQARKPPVRLVDGDLVSVTIPAIGTLSNPVISVPANGQRR